jgi:hypothetical protein
MPSAYPVTARRILVLGADRALFELLEEWLAEQGYEAFAADRVPPDAAPHAVIFDAPFDDTAAAARLAQVALDYPRVPILLLSSRLFTGVRSAGPIARALHVSSVLPKPVNRDTLLRVVDSLGRA